MAILTSQEEFKMGLRKISVVLFLMTVSSASAKYKSAIDAMGGVDLKVSEDATLHFRGGAGFNHQLEQNDVYVFKYAEKGWTSKTGSAGLEVELGKVGKLEVSTGGELLILTRKMNDTTAKHDYFEIRPSGLLNLTLPFGGIFKAQHFMRGERRIFRQPGEAYTKFRYSSESRLSTDNVLPLHTGLFLLYRGFSQDASTSLSQWGGGITMEPVENISIEAGYSMLWKPEIRSSTVYPFSLSITYSFDFTK
jgi:opacity protein-like surface antigen